MSDASLVGAGDAYSLLLDTRSYEISFAEPQRGELIVYVNGRAVPMVMPGLPSRTRPTRSGLPSEARSAKEGPANIVAPMPGRILKVLVKKGDRVTARQGLVVVEAMKMENELRSPRDGVVTDVRVAEGASVEARALLVVIE